MRANVIGVIDGMAGSCGKAKVIGEIATDKTVPLGASVTNCMANAGHTFVDEKGKKTVFCNVPVSAVNSDTELFIGPGSAINMERFKRELARTKKYVGDRKIYVHEMTPLIEQRHIDYEKEHIKSGSTFEGCAAVQMEKIARDPKLQFFKTFKNAIRCSNDEWFARLFEHLEDPIDYVMLEGAQGVELSLNHSGNFPHVTSRNVSVGQLLADSGISVRRLYKTLMVIRPFSIRISDVTRDNEIIYTGKVGSGDPIKWSQLNLSALYGGYPAPGDVEAFTRQDYDETVLKHYIRSLPEKYLLQLFGRDYRRVALKDISLLDALELERLFYKSKVIRTYETKLIYLPTISSDLFDNTIIDLSEDTTVTKGERKLQDIDVKKLELACKINEPDGFYLNFFQYIDYYYNECRIQNDDPYFPKHLREYLAWLEDSTKSRVGAKILALGTGAKNGERIIMDDLLMRKSR